MTHDDLAHRDPQMALDTAGGNAALAEKLLQRLLAELPGHLQALDKVCERQDWPKLREQAHQLLGGIRYCGLPKMQQLALELEQSAAANDARLSSQGLDRLREAYAQLLQHLEQPTG